MTMEELSQTAAEEIERREKDISDLARKNEESMNLAVDYEVDMSRSSCYRLN